MPILSLSASAVFFITTNFGAWLSLEMNYPRTLAGLLAAYTAGIPFFQNTVLADLAGTAAFFGLGWLLERTEKLLPGFKPQLEPVEPPPVA